MPKRSTNKVKKRKILYSEVNVWREEHLKEDKAKEILKWRVAKDDEEYHFKDLEGNKIICENNSDPPDYRNRPLYVANLDRVRQEIRRKRWRFNGHTCKIGKTGLVLDSQHRLISLILECQLFRLSNELFDLWEEEPTIDTLVVTGIDEDEETVNTIDTARPRNLTDVIFRSGYFKNITSHADRKRIAKTCQFAVKTLWHRLGVDDAFGLKFNHSEAVDFLASHPKLLECVEFIHIEDSEGVTKAFLSHGYAAAMLYLMSSSTSSPKDYLLNRREESLNFELYDKACEFFVSLSSGDKKLLPLIKKLKTMSDNEEFVSKEEKLAILCKAWNLFRENSPITLRKLELKYKEVDGVRILREDLNVGGIDGIVAHEDTVTQEESKENGKPKKRSTRLKPSKSNPDRWSKGDVAWIVSDAGFDPFLAEITSDPFETESGIEVDIKCKDGEFTESVEHLSLEM